MAVGVSSLVGTSLMAVLIWVIADIAAWVEPSVTPNPSHVDEILSARGIAVSHEAVRRWRFTFGQALADQIRRRLSWPGRTA